MKHVIVGSDTFDTLLRAPWRDPPLSAPTNWTPGKYYITYGWDDLPQYKDAALVVTVEGGNMVMDQSYEGWKTARVAKPDDVVLFTPGSRNNEDA